MNRGKNWCPRSIALRLPVIRARSLFAVRKCSRLHPLSRDGLSASRSFLLLSIAFVLLFFGPFVLSTFFFQPLSLYNGFFLNRESVASFSLTACHSSPHNRPRSCHPQTNVPPIAPCRKLLKEAWCPPCNRVLVVSRLSIASAMASPTASFPTRSVCQACTRPLWTPLL
jgi:hypothetical protein